MARLLLVRHGITEPNTKRRFTGHSNVDLNAEGYRQAERLGSRLAEEKIDTAYSSDLRRTMATAEAIRSGRDMEIIPCPELRELNYGVTEGLTYHEIAEQYPEIGKSISDFSLELEFPEGESFRDLYSRAADFLGNINHHPHDRTVLIVSHGGMLRTLTCKLLGLEHSHWAKFRFDNASLTIIDTYREMAILSLLNDTSHLAERG